MFNLKDFSDLKGLKNLDRDDLLEAIGLERKRSSAESLLPALGFFGLGLVVGAGLGLLVAQKPGRELRADLQQKLKTGTETAAGALQNVTGQTKSQVAGS